MYPDWSVFAGVAAAVIFIWLGILTFLVWQQSKFLKSLFPKEGERDIRKKFAEVISTVENFKFSLAKVEDRLLKVQTEGLEHIQRVQLSRYNPYDETGGDQSFSVALLDNEGTGVVLTSLHARSGTRVFAKPVIKGSSGQYKFSKEEEFVVKKAMEGKYE